jgi:hypothetical protein
MTTTPEAPRYPVWRYHATHPAVIVHNEAEEQALGTGWLDFVTFHAGKQTPMNEPDRPTQLPVEPPVVNPEPPERPERPGINPDPDRGDRLPHPEQPIAPTPPPARPKKKGD